MTRNDIVEQIIEERVYQQDKWGNEADDGLNTPNDFVAYITHHSTRWFKGGFVPYSTQEVDDFRKAMIKTAALAVAAIESLDRQRENNGYAFYEDETK